MSLGFHKAGFTIDHGFDNWNTAVETYNENMDHPASLLDLGDVHETLATLKPLYKISSPAIIGGPPCQDFSAAGHRKEGARADLTEKYANYVAELQPPFFVMENVPTAGKARAYQSALSTLTDAGYCVDTMVLSADLCGVPQARKRLFAIGTRSPQLTEDIFSRLRDNLSEKPLTVREYFGNTLDFEHYYNPPRSYTRRGIYSIDSPAPTLRGVNRPIPPNYQGHRGDSAAKEDARSLTYVERAQIQTFPKDYVWTGSATRIEQMIGNAVPVNLAYYVASHIRDALSAHEGWHSD